MTSQRKAELKRIYRCSHNNAVARQLALRSLTDANYKVETYPSLGAYNKSVFGG